MSDGYADYTNLLHALFEKQFSEAYKQSNAKHRARLLPYVAAIYRRWLYATLAEDTLLSPANIIASANHAYNQPADDISAIRLRTKTKYTGFRFDMRSYTLDVHPVVDDLRKTIEFCTPSVELLEDDSLDNAHAYMLAEQLSLCDPHYASYLVSVALWMKLMKKTPAIYTNHAQIAKDCAQQLDAPNETLFNEIVEATIQHAACNLSELIALPEPLFGETFVRTALKQPMETEAIFRRAYDQLGITMEEMFDGDGELPSDDSDGVLEAAILSGTFMMGIVLDKYFHTPFGYYLKLIRPVYMIPFDFENEINHFFDPGFENDDLYTAFFSPCTRYFYTDLGLAYFKVKPTVDNYINMSTQLPFAALREYVLDKPDIMNAMPARKNHMAPSKRQPGIVYALKIKSTDDPSLWLYLDMPAEATLHQLYQEIATCFSLRRGGDYSIFHDETENPFAEYTSPQRARRVKKAAETTLSSLDFVHQPMLLLLSRNPRDVISSVFIDEAFRPVERFTVEMTGAKAREPGKHYPAVMRTSKGMKDYNEWEDDEL